jgi:hypothetical protein
MAIVEIRMAQRGDALLATGVSEMGASILPRLEGRRRFRSPIPWKGGMF